MTLKGLVITPNDGDFLFDIGECDTQEGVECLEDQAELIQDCTELGERNLFLGRVSLDGGLELSYD